MERRSPLKVVLFTLLTLGIYGIYWFYVTSKDIIQATGRDSNAVLWLIGLFIPVANLVVIWFYTQAVEDLSGDHSGALLFVLWLVFVPAGQYLVQQDINAAVR